MYHLVSLFLLLVVYNNSDIGRNRLTHLPRHLMISTSDVFYNFRLMGHFEGKLNQSVDRNAETDGVEILSVTPSFPLFGILERILNLNWLTSLFGSFPKNNTHFVTTLCLKKAISEYLNISYGNFSNKN